MEAKRFKSNETTKLFGSLGVFFYICWLPLFWEDNISLTKKFRKYYDKVRYVVVVIFFLFTFSSVGSLFTQNNLTARQSYDRSYLATVTPFVKLFYATLSYNKKKIGNIFYYLSVVLRELYNDLELEKQMTRKVKMTAVIFFIGTMLGVAGTNGLVAVLNVVAAGEMFCPVIPVWPDVADTSAIAVWTRAIHYIVWWMYDTWVMGILILLVTMFMVIFYQFKNVQSYFYGLEEIFHDESLTHQEKEKKYEEAFKLGIHIHAVTLWCRKQHYEVCKIIFGAEITLTLIVLVSNLTRLMSGEHDLSTLTSLLPLMIIVLVNLALFMLYGGDITVEALKVSDAMYFSGWENCSGQSSARVRKLVACAIRQAQAPVVYTTLGVLDFSHESYVQVIKLPYTVVSMFY